MRKRVTSGARWRTSKIGNPSQNDGEFDRLYEQAVERLKSMRPEDFGWLQNYIVLDKNGDLVSGPGKAELFADLGAVAVTGEVSNKSVDPVLLKSLFRELNEYVEPKFKSGQW